MNYPVIIHGKQCNNIEDVYSCFHSIKGYKFESDNYVESVHEYDWLCDIYKKSNLINQVSLEQIASQLKISEKIEICVEDIEELLNLSAEKMYVCPDCGETLIINLHDKNIECVSCKLQQSLEDNYLCPWCNSSLGFHEDTGLFECKSCKQVFTPFRFMRPRNNIRINEIGEHFLKVSPNGKHLTSVMTLPNVAVYPNPYR